MANDCGACDANAPEPLTDDGNTERHLLEARRLLREARSRFEAQDDAAVDVDRESPACEKPGG